MEHVEVKISAPTQALSGVFRARFSLENLGELSRSGDHSHFNRQTKKPIHRHQQSEGALLSPQNDVLCIGFKIQRWDCLLIRLLADSTKAHRVCMAVLSPSLKRLCTHAGIRRFCRIFNQNSLYSVIKIKKSILKGICSFLSDAF